MGDRLFLALLVNSLLFSFIFWALTAASKFFYYDKYSNYKLDFYECGFKSLSAIRINIPVQFVLVSVFLIVYDSEFLLMYPAVFNLSNLLSLQFLILVVFIAFLYFALLVDYVYSALDWSL